MKREMAYPEFNYKLFLLFAQITFKYTIQYSETNVYAFVLHATLQ